jgi:hypothetical protein
VIDGCLQALAITAAAGTGLPGGVFFVFSAFRDEALGSCPPPRYLCHERHQHGGARATVHARAARNQGCWHSLSVVALRHLDQRWAACQLAGSTR